MRRKWLIATATGASLSLLSAGAMAQLRTDARGGAESPKVKAVGIPGDTGVPKAKINAAERDGAKTRSRLPDHRAADGVRRETRRIPVIDANANLTFRSSQLIGASITDADGRTIGKVVDFVSDSNGNILYPVVSYSGAAGSTGKLFAIPFSGLRFSTGANNSTSAQFAFDPQILKNAPSFSSTRFPDFSDQTVVNELSSFHASLLLDAKSRTPATDATVPANGPGDRVQTRTQAGTPTRPVDPTLPANGPGDRPALVNPGVTRDGTQPGRTTAGSKIPGTSGTDTGDVSSSTATPRPSSSDTLDSAPTDGDDRRAPPTDPSVPANGPGDRVRTQDQAGTPTRPVDPTLPSNGPGDRPATVNPALPRTGTVPGGVISGAGVPGASGSTSGSVVGRTGSPASESIPGAVAGDVRTGVEADATVGASGTNSRLMLRSSQMVGLSIRDSDGRSLGKVVDIVGDTSGNRQFAVLSLSGDKRNIVVPYSALNFQARASGSPFATLAVTPAQLQNAPSFTGNQWPDFSSEEFLTSFQEFYQPLFPHANFDSPTTGSGETSPGGSRSTPGGTRTPDWPSRPIPPGGPVPRPGPDGQFPPTTGGTTPGGSRSTPGGTRTPDFPSRPIPPGGPVPRPGGTSPRPTTRPGAPSAPGSATPGIPIPGRGPQGGATPGIPVPGKAPSGGGAPSGGSGGASAGGSTSGK